MRRNTRRRRPAESKSTKEQRAKADRALVSGLGVVAGILFKGGSMVADSSRDQERRRCRAIVSARLTRDPDLIREILDKIDRVSTYG